MSRYLKFASFQSVLAALLVCGLASQVLADPLTGRDYTKFSQQPMVNLQLPNVNGAVDTYYGHDELSTAYGFPTTVVPAVIPFYSGRFMADDFADTLSSPILHVKWWGSYKNDYIDPTMPVNKFLISFESDVPQSSSNPFSYPGQPLLNQVVTQGPLSPGSGTYTEKLIRGPDPLLGESLYEYNAELHLGKEFQEKADTVYWLKIAAMIDVPQGIMFDPHNPDSSPLQITQWGWHNRDYTIQNTLASPNVSPGEFLNGTIGANNAPIWHFQDDAVSGDVRIDVLGPGGLTMPFIQQTNFHPENYMANADGPATGAIPGTVGIDFYSKDLAFEIYTYNPPQIVPEPSSCLLLVGGVIGLWMNRRRARG